MNIQYEPVIGLEVHVQLATKSKIFCGCSTEFGKAPNSQTCPVCLGLPGALPVLNRVALGYAVKVSLALNCRFSELIKFDRKNYFYPDLPKNFQISQYERPLSFDGWLAIDLNGRTKRIGIKRIHLEEDAGKLIHRDSEGNSLVDYNRSGVPLLEIVSKPDINSPEEAYQYLVSLKTILQYLGVSDCDMEKGSLRCDANISLRPKGSSCLGVKIELKNMNSFKGLKDALEFEIMRQKDILTKGGELFQETRLWDVKSSSTFIMRTKEEAHDYRYFPEPDLPSFVIEEEQIRQIGSKLPELPSQRRGRLIEEYEISHYQATVLTSDKELADYFEQCAIDYNNGKALANWIIGELLSQLNLRKVKIGDLNLQPSRLVAMLTLIDRAVISGKMAKVILQEMIDTGKDAQTIVQEKGLSQILDVHRLEVIIEKILGENERPVNDYKKGKKKALMFLVGKVMEGTGGRANPEVVSEILERRLNEDIRQSSVADDS